VISLTSRHCSLAKPVAASGDRHRSFVAVDHGSFDMATSREAPDSIDLRRPVRVQVTQTRANVIGTPLNAALALGSHSLTLTLVPSATKAGTLPSRRVVLHGVRSESSRFPLRYNDPLGLPLRGARLRLWLIRATLP